MRVGSISDIVALDGQRVFIVQQHCNGSPGQEVWSDRASIAEFTLGDSDFDMRLIDASEAEIGLSAVFTTRDEAVSHQFMIGFYGEAEQQSTTPSKTATPGRTASFGQTLRSLLRPAFERTQQSILPSGAFA